MYTCVEARPIKSPEKHCCYCLKNNIDVFKCKGCGLNHYCNVVCYKRHEPYHKSVCQRSRPVNFQATECLEIFKLTWFTGRQISDLTRIYHRIEDILKMHFDRNVDFKCDMSPGDLGFQLHLRGGHGHSKSKVDELVRKFWAMPGMTDFLLNAKLTHIKPDEEEDYPYGENPVRATVEFAYLIINVLCVSATYDLCRYGLSIPASGCWDGGSDLRMDSIGKAAQRKWLDLICNQKVVDSTGDALGPSMNFVHNVISKYPHRAKELLERGLMESICKEYMQHGHGRNPARQILEWFVKNGLPQIDRVTDAKILILMTGVTFNWSNSDFGSYCDWEEKCRQACKDFMNLYSEKRIKKAVKAMAKLSGDDLQETYVHEEHHWRAFWGYYVEQKKTKGKSKSYEELWEEWNEIRNDELYKKGAAMKLRWYFRSEKLFKYYKTTMPREDFETRVWKIYRGGDAWEVGEDTVNLPFKFKFVCLGCGKVAKKDEKFQACSRCKNAIYCSRKCQKKDWKRHKSECKKAKEKKNDEVELDQILESCV